MRAVFFAVLLYCCSSAGNPAWAGGIAVLSDQRLAPYQAALEGFAETVAMPHHQYILAGESPAGLERRLRAERPDGVFALGREALLLARKLNLAPLVYAFVLHPEPPTPGAFPETGIAMHAPVRTQFAALTRVSDRVKIVGVVYDAARSESLIEEARLEAGQWGLSLAEARVTNPAEAVAAWGELAPRVQALWMVPDLTTVTPAIFQYLLELSYRSRLPLLSFSSKYVRSGALLALSFDSRTVGRQAGRLVGRLLAGEALPAVFPPDEPRLSINVKTARTLGLSLPPALLGEAAERYPEEKPP
jgi:putative ABC transport system substrate-binding protein